ncbi:MAG: AsmA family protein [Acidobacteria bacterium]|jgi:hypothetical protein|nr:AsmA family protein [Bryobacteraceae bacterium CoA2 C42]
MKKNRLWLIVVLLLAALTAAPFWKVDRLAPVLAASLERALQRKVEVGAVRLHLLTGPGFTLRDVVIHEDPAISAEPLAYVTSLVVRLRLSALLRGALEFSALRLEEPSVNVMQTATGRWNVQALLQNSAQTPGGDLPDLAVRGGRLNIKLDGTKSIYYFTSTDLDFSAQDGGQSFEIWFRGEPARTDRPAQGFGQVTGRGRWLRPESGEPRLEIDYRLEPSAIEEWTSLLASRNIGLHGRVESRGRLAGPVTAMQVTGQLTLSGLHYWNQPPRSGQLQIGYQGLWNLSQHEFRIATGAQPDNALPLRASLAVESYLSSPRWRAELEPRRLPLGLAVGWLRPGGEHFADLQMEGLLTGQVAIGHDHPAAGQLSVEAISLADKGVEFLKTDNLTIAVGGGRMRWQAPAVNMGQQGMAAVEYEWNWLDREAAGSLQAKSVSVEQLRQLAALAVEKPPLVDELKRGQVRGQIRFHRPADAPAEWSGVFQLSEAVAAIPEFAEPVEIRQAAVELRGERLAARGIAARAGKVAWTGDYQYDPGQRRPHRFAARLPQVAASELEKLLAPALARERGFLARTLGIGEGSVPDWLASRRAEGTIAIETLNAGPATLRGLEATVQWDASRVTLPRLRFRWGDADVEAELAIDLQKARPVYTANGRATAIPWQGGKVNLLWRAESQGTGADVVRNARLSGEATGEQAQAGEFLARRFRARFGLRADAGQPALDLDGLEAETAQGTWTGKGRTLREGKLAVDLTLGDRETKLSGQLYPLELH